MIKLTEEERAEVEGFIRRGKANVLNVTRAHILLKSAEGWSMKRLAETFGVSEAAVRAALTFKWSSGQVEGQVNRLKVIKRVMYGRAKFDLLRLRVLHPP